ncbi:MAG: acylphosphatase [Elusimicrobiales bacterium]|nr:acylphosphatase [Elusimicrobiales bacterium]
MKKRIKIKIFGQVQGVCFRRSIKKTAKELCLTGLVRNESDSTVYVEVEGKEDDLKKLIKWCHVGPEFARVERVEIEEKEELKNFQDFVQVHEHN